jgi:hypothetical protein
MNRNKTAALMMEAASTLVNFYKTTGRNDLEDGHIYDKPVL